MVYIEDFKFYWVVLVLGMYTNPIAILTYNGNFISVCLSFFYSQMLIISVYLDTKIGYHGTDGRIKDVHIGNEWMEWRAMESVV